MTGPLPDWLAPLTIPASMVYRKAVTMRLARYDRPDRVASVPVPVVSVGNIAVGGTGKTPMVRWIVAALAARERRPLVAMRGYGERRGTPDEELEYARLLPGVPLVVRPDRAAGIRAAVEADATIDCAILDDGFQHRRLRRDFDLVLVDASRPALDGPTLPAGWLRESPGALARADGVVVTRAEALDEVLATTIRRHHGRPPIAWCRHRWTSIHEVSADGTCEHGCDWLDGRRVVTSLGIGHPTPIRRQIESHGGIVVHDERARDHQRYDRFRVESLRERCGSADAMLVTLKDWVKLESVVRAWPVPIVVPELSIEFVHGEDALTDALVQATSRDAGT